MKVLVVAVALASASCGRWGWVSVLIFGRATPVELDFGQVEKA